jgi:hypothetical protein
MAKGQRSRFLCGFLKESGKGDFKSTYFLAVLTLGFGTIRSWAQNEGLLPVATNVWSAPNRTLATGGMRPVRKSFQKSQSIPLKRQRFIPLYPAKQNTIPSASARDGKRSIHGVLPVVTPQRAVLPGKLPSGAPSTLQGPRAQPFNNLYRDPSY